MDAELHELRGHLSYPQIHCHVAALIRQRSSIQCVHMQSTFDISITEIMYSTKAHILAIIYRLIDNYRST